MAILEIVKAPDTRLKLVSQPVPEVDRALKRFMDDMFDTMKDANGIGLAAIQVGVPKRVAVIDLDRIAVSGTSASEDHSARRGGDDRSALESGKVEAGMEGGAAVERVDPLAVP